MRIRNCREVPLAVPSLHLHVLPGGEARIPEETIVPDGFELVQPPVTDKPARGKRAQATTTEPAAAPAQTTKEDND